MIKILLEAPILTRSGYGEHSRLVFRSLIKNDNVKVFIDPLAWGTTPWLAEFTDERKKIEECISNQAVAIKLSQETNTNFAYDIQVRVGIPNEFEKRAPYSVCVTAGIETDRVSANWLMKTYQGIDKLIVPSNHSKSGFTSTSYQFLNQKTNEQGTISCNCPVEVVPYPVKNIDSTDLDFTLNTKFNFLSVSLVGQRKNMEKMLKLFLDEFGENEEVGLVLKTAISSGSIIDREKTKNHFSRIMNDDKYKDIKCKVYLLHGDLTDQEVHSLYVRDDIHAYVTTTHGEGYGLPIFEAAYSGMPIVATDWSAHLDFLSADYRENGKVKNKKLFAKVDYELKPINKEAVWKDILEEGSQWAYPVGMSFRRQIRNVYKNFGMYQKWASVLKESLNNTHEEGKILQQMHDAILERDVKKLNINTDSEEVLVL
tara:strand:- start:2126 stop:3406 length:1281 start_codon:yes stop_codon:yes gene_type:complete